MIKEDTEKLVHEPVRNANPDYFWLMEQNRKLCEENHKMKLIINLLLEKIMKNRGDI